MLFCVINEIKKYDKVIFPINPDLGTDFYFPTEHAELEFIVLYCNVLKQGQKPYQFFRYDLLI